MQSLLSSLSAICILFTLGRTTFVLAATLGYDCDNEFFDNSELKEIADQAMVMSRLEDPKAMELKRVSNWYDGPPFTKPYLLWPLFHSSKQYKEPAQISYRVALDENFEVFSVVMKRGKNIRECKMRENFTKIRNNCNYNCAEKKFKTEDINIAAKAACPHMRDGTMRRFPARYDGPYEGRVIFTRGRQLYLFPLLESGVYEHGNSPGSVYVLLNSKCQVQSVLRKKESSGYEACDTFAPLVLEESSEEEPDNTNRYSKHRYRPY